MNSLVFLIPLSILLLVGAGIALFWAIDHGQFDDMEAGSLLPVVDADRAPTQAARGEEHVGPAGSTRGTLEIDETRGTPMAGALASRDTRGSQ
jgi:cbb3-type cytochrome oxidase maturation protein